jgi:hypothetical protein
MKGSCLAVFFTALTSLREVLGCGDAAPEFADYLGRVFAAGDGTPSEA